MNLREVDGDGGPPVMRTGPPSLSASERFRADPRFALVVDKMEKILEVHPLGPEEFAQAAQLASIRSKAR